MAIARLRICRLLAASIRLQSCHSSFFHSLDLRHIVKKRLLSSFILPEASGSTSTYRPLFLRVGYYGTTDNALLRQNSFEISSSSSGEPVYKAIRSWNSSKGYRKANISVFGPALLLRHLSRKQDFLFLSPSLLTQAATMSTYSIVEKGSLNTMDYRIYFNGPSGVVSPFHDIPLHADSSKTVFNMVVEIPRWTNHKMEICKEDKLNPIKQDVKKGKVRFVKNLFPHHGYIWNYGAFPQTWEDPNHTEPETNTKGDSDPIDVCEIGSKIHKRGAVIQVKVVGVMCLIDEGETDWKVLAIDVTDPLANEINDVEDIEKKMPGFLKATYEWFRYYKVPDGKPENQFAFNGEAKNKAYALKVVEETHKQWQNLMNKTVDAAGISCENTTVGGSPYKFGVEEAKTIVENAPAPGTAADLPSDVDQWHYISK